MSVDFAKLNKPGTSFGIKRKNTSVSTQAAKNLANSSPASRMSIFTNSRPPNFVAGQNVAKNATHANYQGARMRNNRPFVPRNPGYSGGVSFTIPKFEMPKQSGIEKLTQTVQQGVMLGQTIQNGIGAISGLFGSNSAVSQLLDGVSGLAANKGSGLSLGTMTSSLFNADSFSAIGSLEEKVKQTKADFENSYAADARQMTTDVSNILNDASEGLALVSISNLSVPTPSASINMEDLDSSMNNIDGDINSMRNFYTNDLAGAGNKVSNKKSEITSTIQAKTGELDSLKAQRGKEGAPPNLEADIQKLESEIKKLKEQEEQLKQAKTAIEQATKQCQRNIDDLSEKKAQLKDIKQFEGAVKDKKYDLAKSQDKQMKDIMKQIDKLMKKDKDGNSDAIKDLQKQLSTLKQSLSLAGNSVLNSKNQTYTISSLKDVDKYLEQQTG